MLDEGLDERGFACVSCVFSVQEVADLIERLPTLGAEAGTRTILDYGWARDLASDPRIATQVEAVIGSGAIAVRGILFDKTPDVNWSLRWHQDTKIAVRERIDVKGYTAWSVKEGVVHCMPPLAILEKMIAVRIHLDPCGTDNGPLRVLPGSHRRGFVEVGQLAEFQEVICTAGVGDLILMSPLLVHSSSKSTRTTHRRVIHLEYCSALLDGGLGWAFAGPWDS